MENIYSFGDALIQSFKNAGFDTEFTSVGRTKFRKNQIVQLNIEHTLYDFELSKGSIVIFKGYEQWDTHTSEYINVDKNIGELNSRELENNLKEIII